MNEILKSAEARRKFVEELPERAKQMLKSGEAEAALDMVLAELKLTQLTNSALRARLDRLESQK